MFQSYIQAAMRKAVFEQLSDDGTYYGSIPGFQGVWSNADTLEECKAELQEILEEWLLMRIADHLDIPLVDGLTISYGKTA